ncbi:MAG: hypothetical protein H0X71_02630 [Rubrobacter sp.]|nr:hypothetical protein [Rubrobacter sp.]
MKAIGPHEMLTVVRVVAGGGILYSAISILRAVRKRMNSGSNSDISQALDELWGRYNRGEISWDEYEVLSRDLEGYRR